MDNTIRITAGLIGFERENCTDCQNAAPCALQTSAETLGVNADELFTIGSGVCPYHHNKAIISRVRHENTVTDGHRHEVRNGISLVQRIVRLLSG